MQLSVVIICKNELTVIGNTLASLAGLTDDIIVYDNGSTDGTQEAVKKFPVQLHEGSWEGFGKTKNKANALAKYDWVLSLDADEAIDETLKKNLQALQPGDEREVYDLRFKNFLAGKWLRFGEWGDDSHIRLFNRNKVLWDDAAVHEKLLLPEEHTVKTLKGWVLHHTAVSLDDYKKKMQQYARMNAEKYFLQGKKGSAFRKWFSPVFSFVKNYFFKLGFLDGSRGWACARINAGYTFLKYQMLHDMYQKKLKTAG